MTKAVAYVRVSSREQGKSGLGLEAQRAAILRHVKAHEKLEIAEWYTEVQSGKGFSDTLAKRPQLAAALNHAKELQGPVVVAKLDRLSRDVYFISGLMSQKVPFVCCDLPPDAPKFMLHIFASVAEWERDQISDRTKRALAAAKAFGKRLGSPNPTRGARIGAPISAAKRAAEADDRAKFISGKMGDGSWRERAARLNEAGYRTATGKPWNAGSLCRLMKRAGSVT